MASLVLSPVFTGSLHFLYKKYGAELNRRYPILARYYTQATVLKVLKYLIAAGFVSTVNRFLNRWAQNNWVLRSDKSNWQWNQEVAVVTGGCSGFGLLVTKGLIKRGVRVAILDVGPCPAELQSTDRVLYQKCDITNRDTLHEAAEQIRAKFGNPSILINNAGIGIAAPILDSAPTVKKTFDINILAHFDTCREFVPAMVKRNKGHVVTLASLASFFTFGPTTDYACSKAAVLAFHEGLQQELKHRYDAPNVHCTSIHPNWARTPIVGKNFDEKRMGKLLDPNDVANAILKQIFAARGAQIVVPSHLAFVSGMRGFPTWVQEILRDSIGKYAKLSTAM